METRGAIGRRLEHVSPLLVDTAIAVALAAVTLIELWTLRDEATVSEARWTAAFLVTQTLPLALRRAGVPNITAPCVQTRDAAWSRLLLPAVPRRHAPPGAWHQTRQLAGMVPAMPPPSCVRQVQQNGFHGGHEVKRGGADSEPFSSPRRRSSLMQRSQGSVSWI